MPSRSARNEMDRTDLIQNRLYLISCFFEFSINEFLALALILILAGAGKGGAIGSIRAS